MNTPKHATDSQIDRLWNLLQLDHAQRTLEVLRETNKNGLHDWMKYNQNKRKKS